MQTRRGCLLHQQVRYVHQQAVFMKSTNGVSIAGNAYSWIRLGIVAHFRLQLKSPFQTSVFAWINFVRDCAWSSLMRAFFVNVFAAVFNCHHWLPASRRRQKSADVFREYWMVFIYKFVNRIAWGSDACERPRSSCVWPIATSSCSKSRLPSVQFSSERRLNALITVDSDRPRQNAITDHMAHQTGLTDDLAIKCRQYLRNTQQWRSDRQPPATLLLND